jgi:hypothetical protein
MDRHLRVPEGERPVAWTEVEVAYREYVSPSGVDVPGELLVVTGTKSPG